MPGKEERLCWGGVILGGGYASRMGRCKILLPLAGKSALEHAVGSMRESGIQHIVVVSGHYHEEMAPRAEALGALSAENSRYHEGMFSSVCCGLEALPPEVEACFLLPGDVPLIKPATYRTMMDRWTAKSRLLHPLFRGKAGHPPLFSRKLIPDILSWSGEEGLRGAFNALVPEPDHVNVTDQGILLDMDTPEDYEQLQVYAERRGNPTEEECFALWDLAETPEKVRLHCRTVQAGAVALGMALLAKGIPLNIERLATAALLHDICRHHSHHAEAGAAFLKERGYETLAPLVAHHMELPEKLETETALEEEILYCVDKNVEGKAYMPAEERWNRQKERFAGNPGALEGLERRMRRALDIRHSLETRLGTSLEQLIGGIHPWA